jgi:pilus assembly protein CpaB
MDRNTRTLIVVLVAIATAGAATFAVYSAIKRIPVREVEVAHTFVAVATRPLPIGTVVAAPDVKLVAWPEKSPLQGAFAKPDPVLNRGVIVQVLENEPITESKLAPLEGGTGLPTTIPEGMRAISVRVNDVIGVAGFVTPGTQVDVLVTLKQGNDLITRVVVTNVQVLTAGTRYDQDKKKGDPIPTSVVTLLLTPEDAERVVLAAADGQLMLALRNPLDKVPTKSPGTRAGSLFGDARPPAAPQSAESRPARPRTQTAVAAPAPPPVAPAVPKIYTVEAIRAAKRSEEAVK